LAGWIYEGFGAQGKSPHGKKSEINRLDTKRRQFRPMSNKQLILNRKKIAYLANRGNSKPLRQPRRGRFDL
jgi:hypothetical protein